MFGRSLSLVLDAAPWKLVLIGALLAFTLFIYRRTSPPIGRGRRVTLLALRSAAFALLAFLLLDPAVVAKRSEVRPPLVLALLDASRSMGLDDGDGVTRLAEAAEEASLLAASLERAGARFEMVPFSSALGPSPVGAGAPVAAVGEGTDIWGALEAAERRYRSENLRGIVLLSDGRVTRGITGGSAPLSTPVFAAGFGDTLPGADVSIVEVLAERTVYRGARAPVDVSLRASGFKGKRIELRLLEDGVVRSSVSLVPRSDDEMLAASFAYVPGTEGEHRLTVSASALPRERTADNNAESIRIRVLKDRIRILYVDQFVDWNMDFLRDLVARSKRIEIETVGWVPGRGYVRRPGGEPWRAPATSAGFRAYDLIIVADDTGPLTARPAADALAAYVMGGGSLLVLADENSPLTRAASIDALAAALPVRRARPPRIDFGGGTAAIASEGAFDPLAAALGEDVQLGSIPPLVARITGLEPVAGARVPLVIESGGVRSPLLVAGRAGSGLSAAVLGFPLWRWRLAGGDGERAYDAFFGGLIQYLAEGEHARGIRIDSDRTVYRAGDPIRLSASVSGGRVPEELKGEIRRRDGAAAALVGSVLFEPDPRLPGSFRAEAGALPAGEYVATAAAAASPAASLGAAFTVLDASVELLDPSRDVSLLRRVADATGGESVDGSKLVSIVPRMNLEADRVVRRDVREIRQSLAAFVAVMALLAIEWTLRKTWGLV